MSAVTTLRALRNPARIATLTRTTVRLLTVGAALLTTACMFFAGPPKDLDYSRTRTSEAGVYRATINRKSVV